MDIKQSALDQAVVELSDLGDRVFRKGLSRGRLLGRARHEVRGLAVMDVGGGRSLAVAGDKSGAWYRVVFEAATGDVVVPMESLPPLPTEGPRRVVERLFPITWRDRPALCVVTRGGGAWLVTVDAVLGNPADLRAVPLPSSTGRTVGRMTFDPRAGTLFGAIGDELLAWDLRTAETEGVLRAATQVFRLPRRVTELAIDLSPKGDPKGDHLYLATGDFSLVRLGRSAAGGFEPTAAAVDAAKPIWKGRLAPIERLLPLSGLRCLEGGRWVRRFPDHRGVIAASLRHLMLIYGDGAEGPATCQVRMVVSQSKILALQVLNLPEWQGIAVATLEGRLRLFRPSHLRRPEDDDDDYFRAGPELGAPAGLLSGCEDFDLLPDRVYALEALLPEPVSGGGPADFRLPLVLGLGNQELRWHDLRLPGRLRRLAQGAAVRVVESAGNVEQVMERVEALCLEPGRRDVHALVPLVAEIGVRLEAPVAWRRLDTLVWDLLYRGGEVPEIRIEIIQALRRLQLERPDRWGQLEGLIYKIRKYVLDDRSFSSKETDFLRLSRSKDPDLADDRVIYRSVLISRRQDPVFVRRLGGKGGLGEVQAFTPLGPGAEGVERFLASNYTGDLWLLDAAGGTHRFELDPSCRLAGGVHSLRASGDRVLLALGGEVFVLPARDLAVGGAVLSPEPLEALSADSEGIEVFAEMDRSLGDRRGGVVWATPAGEIAALEGTRRVVLGSLPGDHRITTLLLFAPHGGGVCAAVGTHGGEIFLLRDGEDAWPPKLQLRSRIHLGDALITALAVAGADRRGLVAACGATVYGLRWVDRHVTGVDDLAGRWCRAWAFRAGGQVQGIHPIAGVDGDDGDERLVVGCHDEHLHLFDLEGRHIESYFVRGMSVGFFAAGPPDPDDGAVVVARVYACAFEDAFFGVRLIDRSAMIRDLDGDLAALDSETREDNLSRWRAFRIHEGHLRHRFIRQSRRFLGDGAETCLEAIRTLIDLGDSSHRPTGEMNALLRRLFQNRAPGAALDAEGPLRGTAEILSDPDLYRDTVELSRDLEQRWDTPSSLANRRVRLFWIRSFLRNLETVELYDRWLEVGGAVAAAHDLPRATPEGLLGRFLEAPHPLVQLKTVQYLQRLLFGWPGVDRPGLLDGAEPEAWRLRLASVVKALIGRLGAARSTPIDPAAGITGSGAGQVEARAGGGPVVLQIGQLLSRLIADGQIDALRLTFELERAKVPRATLRRLADQCLAAIPSGASSPETPLGPRTDLLVRSGRVLLAAHRLRRILDEAGPARDVVEELEPLLEHARAGGGPEPELLGRAAMYFEALIQLLQVQSLQQLADLRSRWRGPEAGVAEAFPTATRLQGLAPFLDAVKAYWLMKWDDIEVHPLQALTYQPAAELIDRWKVLYHQLRRGGWPRGRDASPPTDIAFEEGLLQRVADRLHHVVQQERSVSLLRDYQRALDHLFRDRDDGPLPTSGIEAARRLEEETKLAVTAFSNLFVRLLLLTQPARAAYLAHTDEERRVQWWAFDRPDSGSGWVHMSQEDDEPPPWLDDAWLDPPRFLELSRQEDHEFLRRVEGGLGRGPYEVEAKKLIDVDDDAGLVGFFIFAWRPGDDDGPRRFDTQRHAWSLPLQAIAYRQASLHQEALEGRVYSTVAHNLGSPLYLVRSSLDILRMGFLENQPEDRQETYRQMLRQVRHMNGIVDAMLSQAGRDVPVELEEVSLASLVFEAVRTARREAKEKKRIEIDFPRPDREREAATMFETDEVKVYEIVINLLANAIKYSPSRKRIRVTLDVDRHGAEVRIADQGPGVPEAERERIFEAYYRGSIAVGRRIPGIGLGLYSAKLYTDLLGGRLSVRNLGRGYGAEFTLYLPVAASSNRDSREAN